MWQVNVHTPISPDLYKLDLALKFSLKEHVSFQLATQSECGSNDGIPGKDIRWNEDNLLNETVVLSYRKYNEK